MASGLVRISSGPVSVVFGVMLIACVSSGAVSKPAASPSVSSRREEAEVHWHVWLGAGEQTHLNDRDIDDGAGIIDVSSLSKNTTCGFSETRTLDNGMRVRHAYCVHGEVRAETIVACASAVTIPSQAAMPLADRIEIAHEGDTAALIMEAPEAHFTVFIECATIGGVETQGK